jgi:hypothetical protein
VVASMGMLAASFSTRQASKLLQHLQQIIYNKKPLSYWSDFSKLFNKLLQHLQQIIYNINLCQNGPYNFSVCIFFLNFLDRRICFIGTVSNLSVYGFGKVIRARIFKRLRSPGIDSWASETFTDSGSGFTDM